MMIEKIGFEEGYYLTARDFVDQIRRSNDRWWRGDNCKWVFRGIGNADEWQLVPSAWRERKINKLSPFILEVEGLVDSNDRYRDLDSWMTAERNAIYDFIRKASELGHAVADSAVAGHNRDRLITQPQSLNSLFVECAALAQHHGIPTRLLDWTHDPLVAASVALSDKYGCNQASKACVWALNTTTLPSFSPDHSDFGRGLAIIEQSPARNRYLGAQRGLFTIFTSGEHFFQTNGSWPSIEETIDDIYGNDSRLDPPERPMLVGIALHRSEFQNVRTILEREGLSPETLEPSLDNIAASVLKVQSRKLI